MLLGLISDIHGNAANLDLTLDLLQQQNVSAILCAGDLVDGADEPEAVICTIKDRQIPCVCGNHDTDKLSDEAQGKHDTAISNGSLQYLKDLPFSQTFQYGDKRLLLIHATPWHNGTHVFSYSSRSFLDRILEQTQNADVIVIGHTHEPMAIHYRDRWILNPGSVHQDRFEDRATCAVLDITDFNFEILDIHSHKAVNIPIIHLHNP